MSVWDAISTRRAVRDFADRPLASDHLDRILQAGRRSGSSKNLQRWEFIVCRDRDHLHELAAVGPWAAHLAGAAVGIALVTPDPSAADAPLSVMFDLGQAAAYMMLAGWELGIDVVFHCPLGVDLAGDEIRLGLAASGVVVDPVADPTGTARHVNLMDAAGDRMSFLLQSGDTGRRFNPDAVEPLTLAVDHVVVAIVEQARDVILVARRLGRPVWTDLHDTDGERRWDRDFLEADAIFFSDQR